MLGILGAAVVRLLAWYTCCLPLPMMPKFCAEETAILPSTKGLNLMPVALKVVFALGILASCGRCSWAC